MLVDDVMIREVATIEGGQSVFRAAKLMEEGRVSSLLVVSEGKLIGIVTEKDLVVRVIAAARRPENTLVEEVMSTPVEVTTPDTPLEDATVKMLQRGIKKLPVVEDGHVRGILSLTDVAKAYPVVYATLRKVVEEKERAKMSYVS